MDCARGWGWLLCMFGSGSLCLSRVGFGMVGGLCQVCRYVSNACGGAVIIEWGGQCSLL